MKQVAAAILLALILAACRQANNDNIAIDESNTANAVIETLPPDETVTSDANLSSEDSDTSAGMPVPPSPVSPEQAGGIPAAFHGRWAMVPADCTSTRGDNKGLVVIDAGSIRFFESRGILTKVTGDYPENFTGTFAFTGEGQSWTNSQNLKLTGSSNTLIRKQSGIAQSFTYKRCA